MQDAPGVNCDCALSDNPDGAQQNQRSETIVPEEDELSEESVSSTTETNGGGQDCCSECGSRLEWKLRLDGITVRACPNC